MHQKIIIFGNSKKIEAYFSQLNLDFPEIEVISASISEWELFKTTLSEWGNIVIAEYAENEEFSAFLDKFRGKPSALLLAYDFEKADKTIWNLKELCLEKSMIEGTIDCSRDLEFHYPLLRSLIESGKLLERSFKEKKVRLHLQKMVDYSFNSIEKVKKLHDQVVPLRQEKIKGLKLTSKFAAGEASGGENFDLISNNNKLTLFFSNTNSYMTSSMALSHFDLAKQNGLGRTSFDTFLESLNVELDELELLSDKYEDFQLLLIEIDMTKMLVNGFRFGDFHFVSSRNVSPGNQLCFSKDNLEEAQFSMSLERGEQAVLVSPGAVKNNLVKALGESVDDFFDKKWDDGARDILTELFFQLKKDRESSFLKHDMTAIFLEVDQNAILQV